MAQESDVELFPALAAEQADVVVLDQHLDQGGTMVFFSPSLAIISVSPKSSCHNGL